MSSPSPPPAPDYSAQIQASEQASAADAQAAQLQYNLGEDQLTQQSKYADQSAQLGDEYYQMAQQAQQWGQDQFNQVWPYAQQYLQSQASLNTLAGQNATEQMDIAAQQQQDAQETYDRYMTNFAPIEDQFAQEAQNWATPARQAQASAAAGADVATAYTQQADAAQDELRSYGIDPSDPRYQATSAIMGGMKAASTAAAMTQARQQTQVTGMGLIQQAIAVGQKLPTVALGQIEAANGASQSGLQTGQVGGAGISAANQAINTGVGAMGSPGTYASLSNPYTSLAGTTGSLASSLFSGGNVAMGNQVGAIGAGTSAINTGFNNQMASYQAQAAQSQALWGGLGKLAGGALSFLA